MLPSIRLKEGASWRAPITPARPRSANAGTIDATELAWEIGGMPEVQCTLSVVAESRPQNPWVGLLARKERIATCRFAAAFTFPGRRAEWLLKRRAFAYSGGTAPDLHRLPFYALVGTQGEKGS